MLFSRVHSRSLHLLGVGVPQIVKVDCDTHKDTMNFYRARGLPLMVIFNEGEVRWAWNVRFNNCLPFSPRTCCHDGRAARSTAVQTIRPQGKLLRLWTCVSSHGIPRRRQIASPGRRCGDAVGCAVVLAGLSQCVLCGTFMRYSAQTPRVLVALLRLLS